MKKEIKQKEKNRDELEEIFKKHGLKLRTVHKTGAFVVFSNHSPKKMR